MFWAVFKKCSESSEAFIYLVVFEACCALTMGAMMLMQPKLVNSPDVHLGYTPERLHEIFRDFGQDGRRAYIYLELFDFFPYMFGYTFLLGTILYKLIPNIAGNGKGKSISQWTPCLAILVWISDVVENCCQLYLVWKWTGEDCCSRQFSDLARMGSSANTAKWAVFAICFVIIAIGYVSPSPQKVKTK